LQKMEEASQTTTSSRDMWQDLQRLENILWNFIGHKVCQRRLDIWQYPDPGCKVIDIELSQTRTSEKYTE
jgi:hypothetical protein